MLNAKYENSILTISTSGRIDANNAGETYEQIEGLLSQYPADDIRIDVSELSYISSAGLRVILRVLKKKPKLQIINANPDIYEILEMTGFTEMLHVEKAYKKVSVEGCEMIGRGANGEVYRLDPETVIKVYLNADSLPDIQRERDLARRAFVLGIPTAIPYEIVTVDGCYGSVFELLNAKSLAKIAAEEPDRLDECIRISVDLIKKIHSTEVKPKDMPDMRAVVLGWANFLKDYLPAEKAEKLVALVEAVDVRHTMLHGDYHFKNVMVQNDEALLIDMDTLCQGNPIFELASIFNAYVGFDMISITGANNFLGLPPETCRYIWKKTLALYLETDDENRIHEVDEKAQLIGFARLMRRRIRRNGFETEEGRHEIEFCKAKILELLDRIDTLSF